MAEQSMSAGAKFRSAMRRKEPLQVIGAIKVYQAVRRDGTQKNVIDSMQTRNELYD